jgi:hypothetical protein
VASKNPAVQTPDPKLTALVDEIGDLEKELAPHKPKAARLEKLRKQLRDLYDDKPASTPYTADGARYCIELGARGMQTVVNIPKLFKSVKLADFLKLAYVTLKDITAQCSPGVAASVLTEKQTGHRSLTITEKGKPTA